MGTIRNAQEKYAEGLAYHARAVANICATLGDKHYFAGDCFYNFAVDLMMQEQGDEGHAKSL